MNIDEKTLPASMVSALITDLKWYGRHIDGNIESHWYNVTLPLLDDIDKFIRLKAGVNEHR
jgi:hypothetical protein